jgi:hypothetical protein
LSTAALTAFPSRGSEPQARITDGSSAESQQRDHGVVDLLGSASLPVMKDNRIKAFQTAVEALLESLDAYVRVERWSESGEVPEPLNIAATKLNDRLAAADRLVSGVFVGTPADSNKVTAMCSAMKRLDAAFMSCRRQAERDPAQEAIAWAALEAEIGEVRSTHDQWR